MSRPVAVNLSEAQRALGISPVRLGILRVAASQGLVTAQDLMDELGVSRATLAPHTQALVEAGVLVQRADPSRAGARSGFNRLVWRVSPTVLAAHLDALRALLPADGTP